MIPNNLPNEIRHNNAMETENDDQLVGGKGIFSEEKWRETP